MNISGTWNYSEDFEFGKSFGKAELKQNDTEISGVFTFTEEVQGDYRIEVSEHVKGYLKDGKVDLKSTKVTAKQNGNPIHYLHNTFEIKHISENRLVGSTYDSEGVCGVFVLEPCL